MNDVDLLLAGAHLKLRGSGALWWPARGVLCVSDLHLGKSERMARRGGALLPPFETQDTLRRLEAEITALSPTQVICLGDSFDDLGAARAIAPGERDWIGRLVSGCDWIWVEGNHDPAPPGFQGTPVAELTLGPLTFRHIAEPAARRDPGASGEISGHYHPKVILHGRGRTVRRRAFLHDTQRLILPAFGTYTGGVNVKEAAFASLMERRACAVLTGPTMSSIPVTWDTPKAG